jgi:UDP-N-acetylglucosamine 2-epimerase (non-hydrolysing)
MEKKFAIVFGTRPEYLKLKSIIDEFKYRNLNYTVIYISQHENIDERFDDSFQKIKILNITDERLSNIGSEILTKLPILIKDCSHIIIQGDTATAFYSALTGFQLGKSIIHVEAGLRTYDLTKPFPEEGYRQMISRMSTIHFTPHDDCAKLLNNEMVTGEIKNVGNTILDLINFYNFECKMENTVIITFHRRENWNEVDNLLTGLKKLIEKTPEIEYLWYLHHNPELQNKVKNNINNKENIKLMEPSNHVNFVNHLAKCKFVITDSGGIQEEASFLGKHCIVLRSSTERTHIPKEYITILDDYTKLDIIYDSIPKKELPKCNVYGNGFSSKLILDFIESKII